MKRLFLPAVLFATMTVPTAAQQFSPQVIATTGGYRATNGIQLSWTLGEIATTTLGNNGLILTQGFHQPLESLPSSVAVSRSGEQRLMIYPNPAHDYLSVRAVGGGSELIHVELSGMLGDRRIEAEGEDDVRLNISELPSGTYLVRIQGERGERPETHLITIRR